MILMNNKHYKDYVKVIVLPEPDFIDPYSRCTTCGDYYIDNIHRCESTTRMLFLTKSNAPLLATHPIPFFV